MTSKREPLVAIEKGLIVVALVLIAGTARADEPSPMTFAKARRARVSNRWA